jgi:hypothetical protein
MLRRTSSNAAIQAHHARQHADEEAPDPTPTTPPPPDDPIEMDIPDLPTEQEAIWDEVYQHQHTVTSETVPESDSNSESSNETLVSMSSDGLGGEQAGKDDLFFGFDIHTYGLSPVQLLRAKFLIDAAVNGMYCARDPAMNFLKFIFSS